MGLDHLMMVLNPPSIVLPIPWLVRRRKVNNADNRNTFEYMHYSGKATLTRRGAQRQLYHPQAAPTQTWLHGGETRAEWQLGTLSRRGSRARLTPAERHGCTSVREIQQGWDGTWRYCSIFLRGTRKRVMYNSARTRKTGLIVSSIIIDVISVQ